MGKDSKTNGKPSDSEARWGFLIGGGGFICGGDTAQVG